MRILICMDFFHLSFKILYSTLNNKKKTKLYIFFFNLPKKNNFHKGMYIVCCAVTLGIQNILFSCDGFSLRNSLHFPSFFENICLFCWCKAESMIPQNVYRRTLLLDKNHDNSFKYSRHTINVQYILTLYITGNIYR